MNRSERETFTSRFGLLMTMIGVAVGLGNVWRFPYMVGKFGGAMFVLFYLGSVLFIGVPALMAEWTLGRHSQKGPLGAFERSGLPGGKFVGYFLFFVVICATGYFTNALGWVAFFGISEITTAMGFNINPSAILPPESGFNIVSFALQLLMTGAVIFTCGLVLVRGLREGIEKVSKWIMPSLLVILIILSLRSLTLPGASAGIKWYIGAFRVQDLNASTVAAALGQAVFSLSLGGTFMVIYGSYLDKNSDVRGAATLTALGDTLAGLLAGFAIFPAVFAFGLKPGSGPELIFQTLPKIFSQLPSGWIFGFLFFSGLFGAAYLSDVAAFEVLVAGIVDNTRWTRRKAVYVLCGVVYIVAIPPMVNFRIFVPWDLIFGSGMQTLGALLTVITVFWCIKRSEVIKELNYGAKKPFPVFLYWWLKFVVPAAILFVGLNWLLESVFTIKLFE